MITPRRFVVALVGVLASCLAAPANPLPTPSPRTVVVSGADLAVGLNINVYRDDAAIGGTYVSPLSEYHAIARASVPAEGDEIAVWVRYRGLALQLKTRIDGKAVAFPWNWRRGDGSFLWRHAGSFRRAELGDYVWFINDPKFTSADGVDAVVVTSEKWVPPGAKRPPFARPTAAAEENPNAPIGADAVAQADLPVIEELTEPGSASVEIDWARTGERISPFIYSLNNFRSGNVERMSNPAWHAGHRYMGARMQRLHNGGLVRSLFNAETGDWDYEKIRAALEAGRPPEGVERMFNIDRWPDSFDADGDRRLDPDRIEDFARLCADLVRFVNIEMKAGIRYWEITNETDFAYWRKPRNNNQPDIAALAHICNTVADAMRAVDPTAKYGGLAACSPLPMAPLVEFARLTSGHLDFFSFHHYAVGNDTTPDQVIYEKAGAMAQDADNLIRAIRQAVPDNSFEFFLDEFNICYNWRLPELRMINHKGAVFDALSLIAYSRVPGLTGTNAWNDHDGRYGKMGNNYELRPGAHVYHHFNTKLLGTPAETATSAPNAVVPMAVVDGYDNRPAFVLVNRTNVMQTVSLAQTPVRAGLWNTASVSEAGHRQADPVDPFAAPVRLDPHSVNFCWLN